MGSDDHDLPDVSGSDLGASGGAPLMFQPGDRLDDFEVLGEIGRGGMGVVYRAREHSLNRVVALKVLSPNIASNRMMAMRFRREAVLAANLSHPNIVPVFHIDKGDPPRYFTMEFVEGKSLKDKVEKEGMLRPAEAARIALEVSEALQHAHERNIIHRDIKPSNILLQGREERARVTDFGIAQDVTGTLAEVTHAEGSTSGTPAFMSPEQNLGRKIDNRSDVFSLGMTLYYMLTGRTAFTAHNRQELALAFEKQRPSPPSRYNADVRPEFDRVVLKAIAPDPARRFQSCRDLATALRAAVEPPKAPVPAPAPAPAPTPAPAPAKAEETIVVAKLAVDVKEAEAKVRRAAEVFLRGLDGPFTQKSRDAFMVRARKDADPGRACDDKTIRRILEEEARKVLPTDDPKLQALGGLLPYDEWEKQYWGPSASLVHIILSVCVFCFGLLLVVVTVTWSIVGIVLCLPAFAVAAWMGWKRLLQFIVYYNQYRLESAQICLKAGNHVKGAEFAINLGVRGVNSADVLAVVKGLADLSDQHGDERRAKHLRARLEKLQSPASGPADKTNP